MQQLSAYLELLKQERKKFPNTSWWGLLKYYKRWYASFAENNKNNELPWMTFGVIDFLQKTANESMVVFEYGSGSSTIFWAKRVQQVVSIEHDAAWSKKVSSDLVSQQIKNVDLQFIAAVKREHPLEVNVADPYQYSTDDEQWKDYSFENYVRSIEKYADNFFDFVIVDGRARPSCIAAALQKIKPGGYLVVDNSEREYYFAATKQLLHPNKWQRTDFCGPIPASGHFSQTTVFKKIS